MEAEYLAEDKEMQSKLLLVGRTAKGHEGVSSGNLEIVVSCRGFETLATDYEKLDAKWMQRNPRLDTQSE